MKSVIFLYYLGSVILTVTIGKWLNAPFPITHWLLLLVGIILGLVFRHSKVAAFFYGFLSSFLVALCYTLLIYSQSPLITQKMAKLFHIQPVGLILLMAILQGLLMGLASLTGSWLRKALY